MIDPSASSIETTTRSITPRDRVLTTLRHELPDRVPVDFLATPEVWGKLIDHLKPSVDAVGSSIYFDPAREAVLRALEVDCRVLSYDMFCTLPQSGLRHGAVVDWWGALSRSTPNRMWRQVTPDGISYDIWGHPIRVVHNPIGAYEEMAGYPLRNATSIEDLKQYPWPEPDWWDFTPVPDILRQLDSHNTYHIRFRIGSVFELAWQLRGMQEFLMDLARDPSIPLYIMDRLTEVLVENTHRVLRLVGDRLDMVYFYDDVATQSSLMISQGMWRKYIRPRHARLIDAARAYRKPVMYHCDGALYPLIPALIEMGITVLNPIQSDAKDMGLQRLKDQFGEQLVFHGGIDIIKTLPRGSVQDVIDEVRNRVDVLGKQGGYILCSSHHIQPDTPIENILAMYDVNLRYRA